MTELTPHVRVSFISLLTAICFALVGTPPIAAFGKGPELGKEAPPLGVSKILQAPPEARSTWSALRGKVVVLEFWATWCAPCRKAIPHWNELVEAFKNKPVQFLAVTDENEGIVSIFLKKNPIRSWVGLDGVGRSSCDLYGIRGIPTVVVVNQNGVIVGVTHPAMFEARHIQEVLDTGKCSLPIPAQNSSTSGIKDETVEPVSNTHPVFEVTVRPSGPVPPGHGTDVWSGPGSTDADATGQYASVRRAILTLFRGSETLLDCRTTLPPSLYDFSIRLPAGATQADREKAVTPMFRSVFGLEVHRAEREREVYVLTATSTIAPGLNLSGPNSTGFGSEEPDGMQLSRTTIEGLAGFLEHHLHKPVIDGTGLTNRYDIRLKWKMSKRQLLPYTIDRQVGELLDKPDPAKEEKLSADQQRQLDAIRGKLPEAELQKLAAEDRENIELLRTELAKPEDERFQPDLNSITAAVREQLGLELSLARRSLPILIVEEAASKE